jgi:protein-disulfide isomerase
LLKIHQKAHKAAEASLAAAQEGKFWEMHNELFDNMHSLGVISLKSHARAVGVKSKKFLDELINSYYGIYVQDDLREGINMGVRDVPALFINGKRFEGDPTMKSLSIIIKAQLEVGSGIKSTKKAA